MANIEEISGVYGGVKTEGNETPTSNFTPVTSGTEENTNLPSKVGIWQKLKSILFYEIKVELTPYQQKVEDEINEFLYQEITWAKVKDFLFQEVTFGKKKVD
ncbi:MAG: hypothetical protein HFJ55_00335 [Clostridia bacterium]|nr:hypothetical protein [Clostridia bacterium]